MKKLILRTGEKLTVTEEVGRYYVCGKRRFRKSNPDIAAVEEKTAESADEKRKEE